jgi:hypothetical protein
LRRDDTNRLQNNEITKHHSGFAGGSDDGDEKPESGDLDANLMRDKAFLIYEIFHHYERSISPRR